MNLMTREARYQKHEAPKCRTLGFLCVSVCVLVFFRPNGKSCCGIWAGGWDVWFEVLCFVVFLASRPLFLAFLWATGASSVVFVFFWFFVRLILYSRLLFKAAEFLKRGILLCKFKGNVRVLTHSVVFVCSGGRARAGIGVCVLHVCPPPLPHSPWSSLLTPPLLNHSLFWPSLPFLCILQGPGLFIITV